MDRDLCISGRTAFGSANRDFFGAPCLQSFASAKAMSECASASSAFAAKRGGAGSKKYLERDGRMFCKALRDKRGFINVLVACLVMLIIWGCKAQKEETKAQKEVAPPPVAQEARPPQGETKIETPAAAPEAPAETTAGKGSQVEKGVVVEVEGVRLTEAVLNKQLNERLSAIKAKIPPDQMKEVRAGVRKQIIDEFVMRTLLSGEVARRKITVTEKEIDEAIAKLAETLPPGVTVDEVLKRNKITKEKLREDLRIGLQVNKLISEQVGKATPTDKEIRDFYNKNIEHFKTPEAVRARHILIASSDKDDDKTKKEKKARADKIRQQLSEGADFADLAQTYSDCPSKASGGDLGNFHRGQMVKAFEDAAFTQKIKDIGPVVETEYGWHIIQVMERKKESTLSLDEQLSSRISSHLQQEKKQQAFETLMESLKSKAKIVVHGK